MFTLDFWMLNKSYSHPTVSLAGRRGRGEPTPAVRARLAPMAPQPGFGSGDALCCEQAAAILLSKGLVGTAVATSVWRSPVVAAQDLAPGAGSLPGAHQEPAGDGARAQLCGAGPRWAEAPAFTGRSHWEWGAGTAAGEGS